MVKHCIVPGCTNKYNSCKSALVPAPDGSRMTLVPACSPAAKRGVLNHADAEFSRCHHEDSGCRSLPFYRLLSPGDKRRKTWIHALRRANVPGGKYQYVCGAHWPGNCRSTNDETPSVFLWSTPTKSRTTRTSLGLPAVTPVTVVSTSVPETQPSTVTETQRATETGPATETQSETQTAMETQLVTETEPETQPTTETQPGTQLSGPEEEPRSATFLVDDVDYECDTTRAQASSKDEPTVAPPPSGNPRDEYECLREALKTSMLQTKELEKTLGRGFGERRIAAEGGTTPSSNP